MPRRPRKRAESPSVAIGLTIEEQLRNCRLAIGLVSELLEVVAVAAPLRGDEGLSAEASLAAARVCRDAVDNLRSVSRCLPTSVLNQSIKR